MPYKDIPLEQQETFYDLVNKTKQETFNDKPLYHYPRTSEEWWDNVNTYWSDLLDIILRYIPDDITNFDRDEVTSIENSFFLVEKTAVYLTKLKESKNIELDNWLQKTWASAPDNGSIHLNKGWEVLCDLCSENYVLYEQPQ